MVTGLPPPCDDDAVQARVDCYDTDGPCQPLSIPFSAFGPQVDPDKGYVIQKIRDDGYYAIGDGGYWMMMTFAESKKPKKDKLGEYDVAIFDFPDGSFTQYNEMGEATGTLITSALDEILFDMNGLTPESIDGVMMIYSHQHMDHIGGATFVHEHIVTTWMPDKLQIIGHESIREEFEHRIEEDFFSFRAPVPTKVIYGDYAKTFKVGKDKKFSLTPLPGHTIDKDVIIYVERDEKNGYPPILMYVDVVFPGWAPFFSFALTQDLFHYIQSHEYLMEEYDDFGDDGIFIGGHLSRLGSRVDIVDSYNFLWSVIYGAEKGMREANLFDAFQESGIADEDSVGLGNVWLFTDLYTKEKVRICAKEVVAEWGCKLGGIDIVIDSHCRSAESYLRIDL